MLEICRIDGVDYYDTLSKSEYYADAEKGEPAGKWGAGAEKIGIDTSHPVQNELLKIVMTGHRPDGQEMVQNAGKPEMRVGMDLTFSAPKSVSVLWANADPELREKISQAQQSAVQKSMEYLRERVQTRLGKNVAGQERKTETPAALIYATFEHCDTRAKDPNLHTHTVLSNCVVRENGKTSAIDQNGIFVHTKAAGATYRSSLANDLRDLGFKLEADKDVEGVFQICGFDKSLEKHFSKRSEQIKQIAKATGFNSPAARDAISRNSRDKKTEIDRPALFERWQQESQERGFDASKIEALKAVEVEAFKMPTAAEIVEKLTEHESFFHVRDVERVLAECGQYVDFDQQKMRDEILADPACAIRTVSSTRTVSNSKKDKKTKEKIETHKREITTTATVYTSQRLIDLEKNAIESAKARKEETRHHLPQATVQSIIQRIEKENGFELNAEQRDAVNNLTQKTGGIALLRGLAGTGKTTALKAVSEAFKSEGYQVLGATLSSKAAGVLSRETGLKGMTIAQLLIDLDSQKIKLKEKSLLILDEAGMVGSRDFARLQSHMDRAGAKLIATGDEKQLQAISAGGIFAALQIHAGLETSDLKNIRRQGNEDERLASNLFYEGRAAEALDIYEKRGAIQTYEHRDQLMVQLSKDYSADTNEFTQKTVLAATNAEATLLNEQIREELKTKGQIDRDTAATFENADGNQIEISKGDRVIFKKNSKTRGVQNNTQGTVQSAKQDGENATLKILCDDGKTRTIETKDYKDLRHGYAITGHSSQGETVKNAYVLFNRGVDMSWGYVSMTRHKQGVKLYATQNDRQELAETFSKMHLKGTTLDLKEIEKPAEQSQDQTSAPSQPTEQASSAKGGQQSAGTQMPQQSPQAAQGAQTGGSNAPPAGQKGGVQQSSTNPSQKINWTAIEKVSPTMAILLKQSMNDTGGDRALLGLFETIAASHSNACEKSIADQQHSQKMQEGIQRRGAELER